ncbi:unnamed protein product [marine sediment metagenome]|uniref:Uncharacterized protein n=1 Tax=marine sediment metagenome TaxID=412755 RepID=X1AG02_9ZZZZ
MTETVRDSVSDMARGDDPWIWEERLSETEEEWTPRDRVRSLVEAGIRKDVPRPSVQSRKGALSEG